MKRYPFQPDESQNQSQDQNQNRFRHWLSTLLFLLAFGAGVAAIVIYFVQSRAPEEPDLVRPTSVPGQYDLGGVVEALRDRGLTVEYGRSQARSEALAPPAQTLTVDDAALYIFIYPDEATRATQANTLTAADIRLATAMGTPVPVTMPELVMGSNIVGLLDTDSAEIRDKVTQAIEELP
ncbi:MAG: hypothetical protein M3R06_01345 [Chloroflexota bacterium]|nr:hypothetical protein [Chloroflexota bacterium]